MSDSVRTFIIVLVVAAPVVMAVAGYFLRRAEIKVEVQRVETELADDKDLYDGLSR